MENPFIQITERLDKIEELLNNSIVKQSEIKKEKLDYLNIDEASKFLTLKKSTIYKKVNHNELPYYKRGKHLYFSYTELNDYIKGGKVKSDKELKNEASKYINHNFRN